MSHHRTFYDKNMHREYPKYRKTKKGYTRKNANAGTAPKHIEALTNAGLQLADMCRRMIRAREMKNARTVEDYCFWMHHDTAADLAVELGSQVWMQGYMDHAFGVPIYRDSKMEYGEISLVRKSP